LFPVVSFSKCVVTEVVLFPIVAFKTMTVQKVVWRHTWGVVGSLATVLSQMSRDSESEKKLKIGRYLMKLKRMTLRRTKSVSVFWGHPVG